jgi:hypothetical protein
MTTELATTPQNTTPTTTNFEGAGMEGIEKSDLVLPRVWLMQAISQFVSDERFKAGDIVNSLSEELINPDSPQGPIEIIPITQKKLWYEFEDQSDGKQKLNKIFDSGSPEAIGLTAGPVEGTKLFYRACIQYYVVLASEPDGLPSQLNFMKTNYPTGKKLNTFLVQQNMLKQPAWGKAYQLKAKKTTNDHGTFFVWEFGGKRDATDEEKAAAQTWHSVLQTTKVAQEEKTSPSDDGDVPF